MFSKTMHLMLAAVTRYAVGLVYQPENGFDAMEELEFLKNAILKEYINELEKSSDGIVDLEKYPSERAMFMSLLKSGTEKCASMSVM